MISSRLLVLVILISWFFRCIGMLLILLVEIIVNVFGILCVVKVWFFI